jgi:hypothetical protein
MAVTKPQAGAPAPWRPLKVETDEKLEELLAQPGIKGGTCSRDHVLDDPFIPLSRHLHPPSGGHCHTHMQPSSGYADDAVATCTRVQ